MKKIEGLKCLFFTLYVTIFVLKSFSFKLLLSLVRSDFRLYFVSVNEYIAGLACRFTVRRFPVGSRHLSWHCMAVAADV